MTGYEISYLAAAGGGLISFLSPCVLPLVPGYICFLAGASLEEFTEQEDLDPSLVRRALWSALAFVLGFTTVFVTLGAGASTVSRLLLAHKETIGLVAGAVIVVFGLHYMGLFRLRLLDREARFNPQRVVGGVPGAYLLGLAFAFGWTPCIGPILATILTIAAIQEELSFGVSLLTVYSLGLGIPFLLAAFAVKPFMNFVRRFRRHMRTVEIGAGGLLVVTGVLIFTGQLQIFGLYLLEVFPGLGTYG